MGNPNRITSPVQPSLQGLAGIALRTAGVALASGLLATAVALLAGCTTVPPESIVEPKPTVSLADQPAPPAPQSGAIYSASTYRPLFEDRRARLVGDNLTIAISERTSAGKNVANTASKDGKVGVTIPGPYIGTDLSASQGISNSDKAEANAANNFTGTVTATVTEVLPNGNLRVRGEKQVAFDRGTEYIRFSGIVNPVNIGANNTVQSTAVADMRVEYRTGATFDRAAMQSALARFFFSILPL